MCLFCSLDRNTHTSPGKGHMTNDTLLQSRPEDADISRQGANDDVSHCMLSSFESYGLQMRLFCSVNRKMPTSPGKV